jgi:predicted GNAT family acetyltransferase
VAHPGHDSAWAVRHHGGVLTTSAVRVLGESDVPAVLAHLAADPVANVFVESRIRIGGGRAFRMGGELWGYVPNGFLRGVCYSGANLVPACDDVDGLRGFAERALRSGRRCSSIVGPADQVAVLWDRLAPEWGPGRDVRVDQPVLEIDTDPLIAPDPRVRLVRPDEIDTLLPASVAMFTEEVGVSPVAADGGALYRARVSELIHGRRSFARIDDGAVVFKAEVGAVTPSVAQVQGVWVAPERRGEGLAAPAMAAVVALTRRELAPTVSLYVNGYNTAALRTYDRVGFHRVDTFSTVLF